jgi:transposase-like protein
MGYDPRQRGGRNRAMIDFKGSYFERDVILWGVRWYVAYPMSYRQFEEMMEERGVEVDHSTLNRWVVKYAPLLEKQFRVRKLAVGSSWRFDETYVKVKGCWKYLYRAVDKAGATVDFLLPSKRHCKAALRFLRKAVTRPMLGFKSFRSAAATLSGIELMHMIRKGQLRTTGELRPAQKF